MPPESFLIWGAGGHGKVVYDLLHALGHRVVGWIDRDPQAFHTLQPLSDTTIRVGQEEFMELARTTGYPKGVTAVALGIGDNRARLEALTNLGALPVPSLVHPSAVVSPLASVGRGTVIFPVAVVSGSSPCWRRPSRPLQLARGGGNRSSLNSSGCQCNCRRGSCRIG